ncbi:methylated-DNA--[protein]-cysteine S-methyltransferase [Enterococcus sp. AZ072]|uniref:methylated-DNA--[protein]-cysteine S-methyltransferase n=1 Tax=unclassified Enterococcus TaxID=2608891 RepID=UPI003D266A07
MHYVMDYSSPIGPLTLAAIDQTLVGVWMKDQKYYGAGLSEAITQNQQLPVFLQTKNWLDAYFANEKPAIFELPLKPVGNEFRQTVWTVLCQIPYGEVMTYKEVAQRTAEKLNKTSMSAQAIGGAVGHNPLSIIIPCHRVVGTNSSLTGYAGGLTKKIYLLQHEGVDTSKFLIPTKGTAL